MNANTPEGGSTDTPTKAPRKQKSCLPLLLIPILFVALVNVLVPDKQPYIPAQEEAVDASMVTYRVTGTAESVSITMETVGGTSQLDNVHLPWSAFDTYPRGAWLYLSAQNEGESGTVTVTIEVYGEPAKTTTSSGAYVIANVSGFL